MAARLVAGALNEPSLEPQDIDRALEVAVQGAQRLECSPVGKLRWVEREALYPSDHPLARWRLESRNIDQSELSTQKARLGELGGAVIAVVGPVGPQEGAALGVAFEFLGAPPESFALAPPLAFEDGPRVWVVEEPGSSQVQLSVSYPVPSEMPWAQAQLVADVLGGGATARLDRRLREELGLVYEARARIVRQPGHDLLRVSTRLGVDDVGAGLDALLGVLEGMGDLEPDELQRARATRLFSEVRALDSLERSAGHLGELALRGQQPEERQRELDALAGVELPELEAAARALLDPRRSTWVILGDADQLHLPLHDHPSLSPDCSRSIRCTREGVEDTRFCREE